MRDVFIALACWPLVAGAHEFWVLMEPPAPAAGTEATVVVGGGHYFPSSVLVVQDRLVRSLEWRSPGGAVAPVETRPVEGRRVGALTAHEPGAHVLTLVVQKPQLAQPEWWARAWFQAGEGTQAGYHADGHGLEIVPAGDLAALRPDATLALLLQQDGAPIEGRIAVVAEAGGTDWLTCRPDQPAVLTLRKAGRYLLTYTKGNQSCSLTFHVPSS